MRWLIALLLVTSVAAHGDEQHAGTEYIVEGTGSLAAIAVAIDGPQLIIHHDATDHADIVVMIGDRNQTTPTEWYVLHVGNATMAVDQDGNVQDSNGTIQRSGAGGDCIVVAAQTWQRQDGEKRIIDTAPRGVGDIWTAWGNGDQCIAGATAPATPDQDSPLPFVVATIALMCVAMMHRR